ncbi:hypothetical protein PR002_g26286 [Phytophthora rubi]|uniref:Uncharacterized protein n=1 Tax=Phytophthora rubi TaxID=129364 RepID=A0A6A3HY81_9STRA|nr:hypothetical protein PR002_g26286 [Phytophthora rubi]
MYFLVPKSPTASDDLAAPATASKLDNLGSEERNVLLVYYLSGVTFMEIAALRHLSVTFAVVSALTSDRPYDNIMATTKIVIDDTLLKPCFDKEGLHFMKL